VNLKGIQIKFIFMYNSPNYQQQANQYLSADLYNSYMTLLYMQAMQNQAIFMSKFAPVQVLINNNFDRNLEENNSVVEEKASQSPKMSEKSTTEDQPFHRISLHANKFSSFRKKAKLEKKFPKRYIFNTISSRKKEKEEYKNEIQQDYFKSAQYGLFT